MDYIVRVKKEANAKTRENAVGATVNLAQLKYIRGLKDIRQASNDTIKDAIQDELKKGIDLKPEYSLNQTEYVIVMPNARIGPKQRRVQKAIFKGEMEIPSEVVAKHRDTRRQRGYR